MAKRNFQFLKEEFFHIYNRGNSKQIIFKDNQDYDRFMKLLYICNSEHNFKFRDDIIDSEIDAYAFDRGNPLVDILAWVLMPNHFHIYLKPSSHMSDMWENKGKNVVTEFMRKVSTAYSKYFNLKYGRTGGLFEGAFKAEHIDNEPYAMYLFSYIHLNPLKLIQKDWKEIGIKDKNRAIEFLDSYIWGSYKDYSSEAQRLQSKIIRKDILHSHLSNIKDFKKDIFNFINFQP